jgi:RNA polymerase-binding transcription factor DksA
MFVFVFWSEGKREGFDKYKLFDVIFTLLALSAMLHVSFQRWFINLNIYHYNSIFLRFDTVVFSAFFIYLLWIAGIWCYSRTLNWSLYRLLDVFAVSQVFFLLVAALSFRSTSALYFLIPYVVLYKVSISVRSQFKIRSGVNFALITALHALILVSLPQLSGRLPIALFLLTITVLTIYFRRRIAMTKTNFTTDFLEFIKSRLNNKDKELQKTESLLKAEDPYMQPGRADGNSESMDEAILEDGLKETTDTRLGLIKAARLQVKRALSFLKIGRYGVCEICGKPIDKARLEVYPEATKCVEHA